MRPASLSLSLVFALASVGTACQALLVFGRDEGGRADDDAPRQGYALLLEHGQPKFERFVDEVPTYIRIDQPLDTNAWTYLAATFDGATGTLFINGVQAGTLSDIRAVPAHVTPAFIGAPSGELSSDPYGFIGAIDEVAVYDHVLTSDRLVAHFKASLPGPR